MEENIINTIAKVKNLHKNSSEHKGQLKQILVELTVIKTALGQIKDFLKMNARNTRNVGVGSNRESATGAGQAGPSRTVDQVVENIKNNVMENVMEEVKQELRTSVPGYRDNISKCQEQFEKCKKAAIKKGKKPLNKNKNTPAQPKPKRQRKAPNRFSPNLF